MIDLILGIKRRKFRDNDPRAQAADAEFKAKRKSALARSNYKCAACQYKSSAERSHLDVHHVDDDHHNNSDENLLPACHTCHPYQHVGELARRDKDQAGEGLGKRTLIAAIPEVTAIDMNLLQRALGAALITPSEKEVAEQIIEILAERNMDVQAEFGSSKPSDFAAAMAALNRGEYMARREAISDLRLLFNADVLKILGREFILDNPSMPVDRWGGVARTIESRRGLLSPASGEDASGSDPLDE